MTDDQVESAAMALHEFYCSLYPPSDNWESIPEDKKEINRAQVRAFAEAYNRLGNDTESLARLAHDVWMANTSDKSHPSMVGYDNLPEREKNKDRAVAGALLSIIGRYRGGNSRNRNSS